MTASLTIETFVRMKNEQLPVLYFAEDNTLGNDTICKIGDVPQFFVMSADTRKLLEIALPKYRFVHIREYR